MGPYSSSLPLKKQVSRPTILLKKYQFTKYSQTRVQLLYLELKIVGSYFHYEKLKMGSQNGGR